jgi:SAM-dependent methyltransferase
MWQSKSCLNVSRKIPRHKDSAAERMPDQSYQARIAAEKGIYEDCLEVHNLPAIFHYWSNRYVRPQLEAFGFSSPNGMFRKYLEAQYERGSNGTQRFVSLGSGNCDLEIELAGHLRAKGHADFTIDCLDLNPHMLERGRADAAKQGVRNHLEFAQADFNSWEPAREYDAVIANQALHHVLNLEGLFARIQSSLKPRGTFLISDIIGHNGHLRWPEALEIVYEFWRKLPPSYRFNQQLHRYEEVFEDWDCSGESFEGIRCQDILPLLLEQFHFQFFFGYANAILPFVDRSFGPNFDATADWDRSFIDQVHQRDAQGMMSGRIKPTQMLAVVAKNAGAPLVFHEPLTPEFCVRSTQAPPQSAASPPDAYEWHTWPHSPQRELEIACRRLKEAEDRIKEAENQIKERNAWAERLQQEFEERTAWALKLDKELAERTAWALALQKELEELAWARQLSPRIRNFLRSGIETARRFRNRINALISRKPP